MEGFRLVDGRAYGALGTALFLIFAAPVHSTPAQFFAQPTNRTVHVGDPVEFTALVAGTLPLSAQWQHDGAAIANETNITLTIPSAGPTDAGSYRLVVTNSEGSATSDTAVLSVLQDTRLRQPQLVAPDRVRIRFGDGGGIPLTGNDSGRFLVEGSHDLRQWSPLPHRPAVDGNDLFVEIETDLEITHRYYRTVELRTIAVPNHNDGIAARWRFRHFGHGFTTNTAALATADPDGDGANNYLEYLYRSDPRSPASRPLIPDRVSTWAGTGVSGDADGPRLSAQFAGNNHMLLDHLGRLYITETTLGSSTTTVTGGHRIRRIGTNGTVSTVAGAASSGYLDGTGNVARFRGVQGIVEDSAGIIYVADRLNHRIRRIDGGGNVSTLVPNERTFSTPVGLAIDSADNIYVGEFTGHRISRIAPDGTVTVFAGTGVGSLRDGYRTKSAFNGIHDIELCPDGSLLVADYGNGRIRRVDPSGAVTTVLTGLTTLHTLTCDPAGNIYVVLPIGRWQLRKYDPQGALLWRKDGSGTHEDGPWADAKFDLIGKPLVQTNGNLLVASGRRIREIHMTAPRLLDIRPATTLFTNSVSLTVTTPATNAVVRYTVDGSAPTGNSPNLAGALEITNSTTVKIRLFVNEVPVSDIHTKELISLEQINSGLLSHWRFDESPTAATVADSAGQITGQLSPSGAIFTPYGAVGGALQLERSGDGFASFGDVHDFTTNTFTIMAWVRTATNDITEDLQLVHKHQPGTRNGYFLNINKTSGRLATGKVALFAGGSGTAPINTSDTAVSTTDVNDGAWHFVAAVYEAGVASRIFVDDGPAEASVPAPLINGNNSPLLVVGAVLGGTTNGLFTGRVDELRIYRRAVTETELAAIYESERHTQPTPPGPVAHYRFNEAPGNIAAQDATGAHHALLNSGASFDTDAVSGNSLKLNRAQNGAAVVLNNAGLDFTGGSFSLSVWVKTPTNDTTLSLGIVSRHTVNSANGFSLQVNANAPGAPPSVPVLAAGPDSVISTGNSAFATTPVNDGSWHHIVAIYQAGESERIYVDGLPAEGNVAAQSLVTTTAPLVIGGFHDGTGPIQTFNGWIDEVQIYDRAVSEAEIVLLRTFPGQPLGD